MINKLKYTKNNIYKLYKVLFYWNLDHAWTVKIFNDLINRNDICLSFSKKLLLRKNKYYRSGFGSIYRITRNDWISNFLKTIKNQNHLSIFTNKPLYKYTHKNIIIKRKN